MYSRVLTVWLPIVLCFTFYSRVGYAQWVVDDEGCRTPDRGVGNCVPLRQCVPMVNVLKDLKRPISETVLKKLQAYTCGGGSSGIKVCCPSGPIQIETAGHVQVSDEPQDVSNHRNIDLIPEDCGYFESTDKIVNGLPAKLNEFPWMALLRYRSKKKEGFDCGGTVINKNYILTAAHCLTDLRNDLISVRIGEHSIKNQTDCEVWKNEEKCNPPVQDVAIEKVIVHPQFSGTTLRNDIGLIRVSTINLKAENARPVCLPIKPQRPYKRVTVTGWGVMNAETGQTSDILQKVDLEVANKETCIRTYEAHNIKLGKKQICAGGVQSKDSCPGDSGGPMMVPIIDENFVTRYIQEGIVSFGPKYCGIDGYPGVYTLVNYYMDWILDNMRP